MNQFHTALLFLAIVFAVIIFRFSFMLVQYDAPYSSFADDWWKYLLGSLAVALIYVLLTG